ncbi:MAG: 16S rRNA (guanine(966)-N(2))-methyltransferase RsmD [Bacilli bacterium]
MIKIIGGTFRSRVIATPSEDVTRPTKSSCREGIFSALTDNIRNSNVLDLFAGSGAYGIESISRGANFSIFNEVNANSYKIISENIRSLKIENCKITKLDYVEALKQYKEENLMFDIVFLDPPYALDCCDFIINYMLDNSLLSKLGILVIETNIKRDFSKYNFSKIKEYKYGYSLVYILRR